MNHTHNSPDEDCVICFPEQEANQPNPTPGQMPRYAGRSGVTCRKEEPCLRRSGHDGICSPRIGKI